MCVVKSKFSQWQIDEGRQPSSTFLNWHLQFWEVPVIMAIHDIGTRLGVADLATGNHVNAGLMENTIFIHMFRLTVSHLISTFLYTIR